MTFPIHSYREALSTMADGTIKQINPFSGTQVWTVPGRGNRPLSKPKTDTAPLTPEDFTHSCAFCTGNPLKTPPEKSRMVRGNDGEWHILTGLLPDEMEHTSAAFRRVPNLFEIVSYDYWVENYQYEMASDTAFQMKRYIADKRGRQHVIDIVRTRLNASGNGKGDSMTDEELLAKAPTYFAGGHDVILSSRHYVDGATDDSQLASSGTLTPEEHYGFIAFTIDAMRDLYENNRYAPYVVVFQNWLSAAGASFDHLHKQLVAIDERGVQTDMEIQKLRTNPNMYNEWAINYASYHNLVIAENDYAILIAGIGHRYPTLGLYSKSAIPEPWLQSAEEVRGMSDLLHAAHAATGADIASNEEWHHKPVDLDMPMPWRINLKWRVSTLAGFEGGTKVYVNTISPFELRDRVVSAMYKLRDEATIESSIRIATECSAATNVLRYNPMLHLS
ncbi:DUF4921 family protein [Corynebacterium cystitidis]|uniref:Galactose-1-phosphate uridylyltransferase n=1 Tax=Corynebacterium cystitidis DSM 20524 TaxID=1121357 RepID=A0A1H9NVR0_9CORY|nr:DUF4921 family protein [Corynebacterium cystitidis]WJY82716.1 hypothetical protein CCYS_09010 [Corynebacterium cystitidis DSM 20524]SER39877.1 Galactose-1-phosphate uridylyltransferase [Corynebacterium cystitidis DSM 20524]SNV71436.1 galactose-1-phosphate uridylyltransferase [Corynebacterium cystitidis]